MVRLVCTVWANRLLRGLNSTVRPVLVPYSTHLIVHGNLTVFDCRAARWGEGGRGEGGRGEGGRWGDGCDTIVRNMVTCIGAGNMSLFSFLGLFYVI